MLGISWERMRDVSEDGRTERATYLEYLVQLLQQDLGR